jgi:hypothetical protein
LIESGVGMLAAIIVPLAANVRLIESGVGMLATIVRTIAVCLGWIAAIVRGFQTIEAVCCPVEPVIPT